MKQCCPECGKLVAVHLDECPYCARWLDTESAAAVIAIFVLLVILLIYGLFLVLNQGEPVNPQPDAELVTPGQ